MTRIYQSGTVVSGVVTGIQAYGAFVALDEHTQGLIHISEITNGYVKDIHDFLKVGDKIKVKVLVVNEENGKISLSLKAVEEQTRSMKQTTMKVLKPSPDGFQTLREKLNEWIKQV
ncbi:S1 domain-containing post-transcriptional regulator GSP13 [Ectobacillus polymachus]|uniref:S1 domain-containing post-transcriptional regulator GSP13 n=1 Tax=Ectobacillus polymachus TaxID=1508806 RepID=UPI003A8AD2BE